MLQKQALCFQRPVMMNQIIQKQINKLREGRVASKNTHFGLTKANTNNTLIQVKEHLRLNILSSSSCPIRLRGSRSETEIELEHKSNKERQCVWRQSHFIKYLEETKTH